jgi:hypothetical protein
MSTTPIGPWFRGWLPDSLASGRRQIEKETRDWERTAVILTRFLVPHEPT